MKAKVLMMTSLLFVSAISAEPSSLPEPVKQIAKQGIEIIKPFKAPGGMEGWLGKYQGAGVTIFLTPDKKHAVSGYIYDDKGNNLSEKIINDEIYIPAGREMWQRLTAAKGITEGSDEAACKVVVFADAFCPYCKKFSQAIQPALESKRIQTKTLLVGMLRPESGQYAAAMLSAKNPAKAWHDFEMSNGKTKPDLPEATSDDVRHQIRINQQLMNELGANGTPAIYYLNKDRLLQQIIGMPDKQKLADLMACK